jgi:hypothetical protein
MLLRKHALRRSVRVGVTGVLVENAYRNVGYYLIALPLILIAGFWIPYLSEIPTFEPSITAAVHIHALLLFAWVGLPVVQPLTIRSNSITLHRKFGKA